MNKKITNSINMWNIDFDPYGFVKSENWYKNIYKAEDILQLTHILADGPIIDVGYYNNIFRVFVIFDENWDQPYDSFETKNELELNEKVCDFMNKYESGEKQIDVAVAGSGKLPTTGEDNH